LELVESVREPERNGIRLREADMAKTKPETEAKYEQQFPSVILYSSPPEASSLNAWLKELEQKRKKDRSASKQPEEE
jgi:hypothetical protein